jgi:hypothetical protein
MRNIFLFTLTIGSLGISCGQKPLPGKARRETYLKDSLLVIYTIKEYTKLNWDIFNDHSKMYKLKNEDINYFIGRSFYSNDDSKFIFWIGEKMINASAIKNYSVDSKNNRICPTAGDTIINMYVLIGYRLTGEKSLKLYPWGNRQTPCYDSISSCFKDLEKYYYNEMKEDYMETVVQNRKKKGQIQKVLYKYSINEKDFWRKSPLWQKDTIGATNLYPFEVRYGHILLSDSCIKCGQNINPPIIKYPDS